MKILNFRVINHRSLRDETVLELVSPKLKTNKPGMGKTWDDYLYPVAGIFGANASGKSNFLDALRFFVAAVRMSAAEWQTSKRYPHFPFKLSAGSRDAESSYELDFVHQDIRYRYGFSALAKGITEEYLEYIPSRRSAPWTVIFERNSTETVFKDPSLALDPAPRELVLSRALTLDRQDVLGKIATAITEDIDFIRHGSPFQAQRVNAITEALADGTLKISEVTQILQIADIGISRIGLLESEREIDAVLFNQGFQSIMQAITSEDSESNLGDILASSDDPEEMQEKVAKLVERRLELFHDADDVDAPAFTLDEESDGTLAWLAISVAMLSALRRGTVVCGDELDSSLHPYLVQVLVSLFTNPNINVNGAQLIFTTHDATLLGEFEQLGLDAKNIWFTEKGKDGSTHLYSLVDFPHPKDANFEKRYLAGRYGAVPRTAPSVFSALVDTADEPKGVQ